VSDKDTDPQNLPSPSVAEAKQAAKREFIPGWALLGIAAVVIAVVLFGVLR
jgi:hypothetical protein